MAKLKRREFKPLNEKRVREGAARTFSKYDSTFKQGVNTLKMKVGVNTLRIVRGTDPDYFGETIWTHGYVGVKQSSYMCPKKMGKSKTCPICEAAEDAVQAGDKEEAGKLSAKERMICYVINRDDEKAGVQVWDMSWTQSQELDAVCVTRRGTLDVSNPDTGFDISIQRTGMGLGTRYSGLQVDRESSPLSENARQQDAWIDEIDAAPLTSLLKYYPEDYLSDILTGKVEEKHEDDDDDKADAHQARRRSASDEQEGYQGDDDRPTRTTGRRGIRDEEEEDRPTQRTRSRADEPDDEDRAPQRTRGKRDDEDAEAQRWRKREVARGGEEGEDDRPTRRSRRAEAEEEEDAPRHRQRASNGEDTGEDRPTRTTARSRRDEPEEERPIRRRREQPEDEDGQPVRRVRREDPEDEDLPRRHRERNDEDEYEAPRSRRR